MRRLDRSRQCAILTGPRSRGGSGNSRAAKPVQLVIGEPDQTITRPPQSAGRARPIRILACFGATDTIVRPVSARALVERAAGRLQARRRRQRSPPAKDERITASAGRYFEINGLARQDQTHRGSLRKRALTTSATQRPQRPHVELNQATSDKLNPPPAPRRRRRDPEPAKCSIRPEFWRIAASILAVMSGLAENALEFSRPGRGAASPEPCAGLSTCRPTPRSKFRPSWNALAIHDVEFDLLERRRQLVLPTLTRVWFTTTFVALA